MKKKQRIVTIFGSGHMEENFPEYQKAVHLGKMLAEHGYTICNGGYGGIMEASARGAKMAGGYTIGVIAQELSLHVNRWIDRVHAEKTWNSRLQRLIKIGGAFVVFDGGTGTLTELFTVWEMLNKRLIAKPMILYGEFVHSLVKRLKRRGLIISNDYLAFTQSPKRLLYFLEETFALQEAKEGAS